MEGRPEMKLGVTGQRIINGEVYSYIVTFVGHMNMDKLLSIDIDEVIDEIYAISFENKKTIEQITDTIFKAIVKKYGGVPKLRVSNKEGHFVEVG